MAPKTNECGRFFTLRKIRLLLYSIALVCFCFSSVRAAHAGPLLFKIDGKWLLAGPIVGAANNGVPVGLESTLVDFNKGKWHGLIADYRYTIGEDLAPHGIALGYELGVGFGGIDISAVTLLGADATEWGGRARGCGVFFALSLCGGVTVTQDRLIFGFDLAAKLPLVARHGKEKK